MKEFEIGDRVKAIKSYDGNCNIIGKSGTVIDFDGTYCVEFDEYIEGHNCMGKGKSGYCWWCKNFVLEHFKNEQIIIYRERNKVIALDETSGKKGVAKCNPEDKFDFMTGAKLALDRLSVGEVKRPAKVGEYIKIVNPFLSGNGYNKGDVLKVRRLGMYRGNVYCKGVEVTILEREYVVLEGYTPVKEVKPHLICYGAYYGEMGKKTNFKDAIGRPLHIGDTVELYNFKTKLFGERSIVKQGDRVFVMGIMGECNNDGNITGDWKIIKKRNYYEIADGEYVDGIKYVGECNA